MYRLALALWTALGTALVARACLMLRSWSTRCHLSLPGSLPWALYAIEAGSTPAIVLLASVALAASRLVSAGTQGEAWLSTEHGRRRLLDAVRVVQWGPFVCFAFCLVLRHLHQCVQIPYVHTSIPGRESRKPGSASQAQKGFFSQTEIHAGHSTSRWVQWILALISLVAV